jgi:hypothetical protein
MQDFFLPLQDYSGRKTPGVEASNMAIKKKSLMGAAAAEDKEAHGSNGAKAAAKPATARKLAVAKLATAKLSTAKLALLRKITWEGPICVEKERQRRLPLSLFFVVGALRLPEVACGPPKVMK